MGLVDTAMGCCYRPQPDMENVESHVYAHKWEFDVHDAEPMQKILLYDSPVSANVNRRFPRLLEK